MISKDTYETAMHWYETGTQRIMSRSTNLGITYLDRAIAVFVEVNDLRMATYARHYKLLGLRDAQRFEEVESLFSEVMHGYTRLEDSYGQALLLSHLADTLAEQARWELAKSYYNLASVVAENDRHRDVLAHILLMSGLLSQERENHIEANRFFERAEQLAESANDTFALARYRHLRGEILSTLGETSEAVALLEDAQARFFRGGDYQQALKPLSLLKALYDDSGMDEDKNRVTQLMHHCGQQMIKEDTRPREKPDWGPAIGQLEA